MLLSLYCLSVSFIGIISTIHSSGLNVEATLISRVVVGGYLPGSFQMVERFSVFGSSLIIFNGALVVIKICMFLLYNIKSKLE